MLGLLQILCPPNLSLLVPVKHKHYFNLKCNGCNGLFILRETRAGLFPVQMETVLCRNIHTGPRQGWTRNQGSSSSDIVQALVIWSLSQNQGPVSLSVTETSPTWWKVKLISVTVVQNEVTIRTPSSLCVTWSLIQLSMALRTI